MKISEETKQILLITISFFISKRIVDELEHRRQWKQIREDLKRKSS